jgi:hypothetical protein
MSTRNATRTTGNVLSQLYGTLASDLPNRASPLPEVVATGGLRIKTYTPVLPAANGWLSIVEQRIRASTRPDEIDGEDSTEWLNSHAAEEAISFFQRVADLLPTEPHISATRTGDLVAEFEAPTCSVTSVVSDRETILFGVSNNDPENPVQVVIRRGSNRMREEMKEFTRDLHSVSHGQKTIPSR